MDGMAIVLIPHRPQVVHELIAVMSPLLLANMPTWTETERHMFPDGSECVVNALDRQLNSRINTVNYNLFLRWGICLCTCTM